MMARLSHDRATSRVRGSGSKQWRHHAVRCAAFVLALAATGVSRAGDGAIRVTQGTDISVAARENALVMALAGRLWRLPPDGGEAVALTPAGEMASRPAFAPDGRLAWQVLRDGSLQITVADEQGSHPRPITTGPWNHLSPVWSPDGRRIAFASDRGGDFGIWELEIETGALNQLTFDPGHETDPAWEPRGQGIAYVREQPGRSAIVLRGAVGEAREIATATGVIRGLSWRPDGSVITYTTGAAQGTALRMVILSEPPVVKPASRSEAPSYGPVAWLDRDRLVYAADGTIRRRAFGALASEEIPFAASLDVPAPVPRSARTLAAAKGPQPARGIAGFAVLPNAHVIASVLGDLWEIDADGTLVRRLTDDDFMDRDPAVSRDGRQLAYVSDRSGRAQVWRRDLATGDMEQLTDEMGSAARPSWSAAGDRVAYVALADSTSAGPTLRVVDVATRHGTMVADAIPAAGTPAWSPDDAHLALASRDGANARLLLFPLSGGALRRAVLPNETIADDAQAQWSEDGHALLVASEAGIRLLPVSAGGIVDANWRSLTDRPARLARWLPGTDEMIFTDADGLARLARGDVKRIPLPITWEHAPPAGRTLVRGARVFDSVNGGYLDARDVLIVGSVIEAVEPQGAIAAERGDLVVEARGRPLLPGLIDVALHVPAAPGADLGRTLLAWGITTVQALTPAGGSLRDLAEFWQARGSGPRLLRSAEWCGGPLGAANEQDVPMGSIRLCPGARGGDTVGQSGPDSPALWTASWPGVLDGQPRAIARPGFVQPDPARTALAGTGAMYQDAVEGILRAGTVLVTGLAPRALPIVLEERPRLVASAQYQRLLTGSERDALARRGAGAGSDAVAKRQLRDERRLLGRLAAAGGRIAVAGGTPGMPYGLGLHAGLASLQDAGLGRADILRVATLGAATALGLEQWLGSIAPGRAADFVLLNGDPLASLDALLDIEAVMVAGRLHPRASLQALEEFTPPPGNTNSKSR